jgi:hypothetical protein
MTLDNLIGKGLTREPTDREEMLRFREKIRTKLRDCRTRDLSLDSRFDLAYEALLQIGVAALRANGLRPDSRGGHHVMALQTLNLTVGFPREKLRLLDEFRRQRAAGLYDGSFAPSETELEALTSVVDELAAFFERWLEDNHPELR